MLPKDFPPWPTVYWWFRRFVRRFLFQTIHDVALMLDRERVGREASPTAASSTAKRSRLLKRKQEVMTLARVRLDGAHHLWRKVPSGELSIDPEADERLGWATGWVEAS